MTPFRIRWDYPALATFYRLSPDQAYPIDRAVIRFAATGEGEVDWEPPYHLLHTGAHNAVLAIDVATESITVLRIYRAHPAR